jgi:preprotein translocase subunit SecY
MSKTCNGCGETPITTVSMSSADWQRNEQRHERREKRLVWVIVLLIVLLVGSNIGWLAYESQFETVETTQQEVIQEADNGENHFIGGDYNGEADNTNDND